MFKARGAPPSIPGGSELGCDARCCSQYWDWVGWGGGRVRLYRPIDSPSSRLGKEGRLKSSFQILFRKEFPNKNFAAIIQHAYSTTAENISSLKKGGGGSGESFLHKTLGQLDKNELEIQKQQVKYIKVLVTKRNIQNKASLHETSLLIRIRGFRGEAKLAQ